MSNFKKVYLPKSSSQYDPFWAVPDRFGQLIENWFNDAGLSNPKSTSDFSPHIELKEDKEGYYVDIELAGIKPEEVDLSYNDKVLTIKGERKSELKDTSTDRKVHYSERFYGTFMRTIPFSEEILEDKINAEFKNGLLKIGLPKKPVDSAVSRKITIKS
jgi:HSP20 family protein